jgi:hypothetical protein
MTSELITDWPRAGNDITVEFFGVTTRIRSPDAADAEHLRYYFREHRADGQVPDVDIELQTEDGDSFIAALARPPAKRMWWRGAGDWQLYEEFRMRSRRASLVPPFGVEPLSSTVRIGHGAAVAAPLADRALVILGPSGAGKSVLLTALMGRGWRFITDDVLVLGRTDGRLRYFGRPLGVRERSLAMTPWASADVLAGVPRIPTELGDTFMVRPESIGGTLGVRGSAAPLWTVRLRRAARLTVHQSSRTLTLHWDPRKHLDPAVDACLRLTGSGAP